MVEPKRILIVRPSALGDVCRTVPVLATLRRACPQATIDWVVQSEFAAAIESHPALDEAVTFPRQRFAPWWRSPAVAGELLRWFRGLAGRRYDVVYDCQGLGRSGLITWATRARRRVGLRSAREFGWLGCNVRHRPGPATHTVERMMRLLVAEDLEPVYDMTLYVAEGDRRWWGGQRDELGVSPGGYAVLAPTSRWPSKRWPAANWSSLIGPLRQRGFDRVVLVGARTERDQVRPLTAAHQLAGGGVIDLVGRTSLGQTMAVIAEAALVIANDSAPLHMAVGFGRPVIGLYGPTDPAAVGPYGAAGVVLRNYHPGSRETVNFKDARLGDRLMRLIRPADVLGRLDEMFRRGGIAAANPAGGAGGAGAAGGGPQGLADEAQSRVAGGVA